MSVESSDMSNSGETTPSTNTQPPGILRNSTNSNNNNRNRSRNNSRRNNSSSGTSNNGRENSQIKSFEGVTLDVGAVLCLSNEDVDKGKEGFPRFQAKLEEYILREYDNAKDLTPLIVQLKDPVKPFEKRIFPKIWY